MYIALQKKPSDRNWEACDMWSFAILLWELATREVPFADLSPMEVGMKVCKCSYHYARYVIEPDMLNRRSWPPKRAATLCHT
jgi:hypothetical protein